MPALTERKVSGKIILIQKKRDPLRKLRGIHLGETAFKSLMTLTKLRVNIFSNMS